MFQINDVQERFGETYAHPQWRKDAHLFRMRQIIWSSRKSKDSHGHPQQRKDIHLCSLQQVI